MALYTKVSGTQKEIKKLYTKVSGTQKEIKEAYTKVSGSLKQIHKSGVALSTLPTGTEIVYNGKRYTLIAHSGLVTGDAVLWTKNGSTSAKWSTKAITTTTTPFGKANTNEATISRLRRVNGNTGTITATGYGLMLPSTTLGIETIAGESPAKFSYFSSNAQRIRYNASGKAANYWVSTVRVSYDDEGNYIDANTYVTTSGGRSTDDSGASMLSDIYAYSVKGTLLCSANSDGSYTLQI